MNILGWPSEPIRHQLSSKDDTKLWHISKYSLVFTSMLSIRDFFFHLSITTVSPWFSINRVCRVRLVGNCSSKRHPRYIHHLWRSPGPVLSTLSLAFPVASFQAVTIDVLYMPLLHVTHGQTFLKTPATLLKKKIILSYLHQQFCSFGLYSSPDLFFCCFFLQ